MKRKICFNDGIIGGDEMRYFIEIFPNADKNFRQRKSFDEYYYDEFEADITIEIIEKLNDGWSVCIHSDIIEIG